ncbi:IclR family transcriptional regulator [Actinomadura graeca]|uniref:IclR family transcriptional regulator n=1 Tax=Actinomadura graeca TaxID=2750812 RepID=A0ABX8QZK2_9ACTN|nr:IclR family transcriptional regulator [Actinomadura graeca]QXJ23439.1 IclR family transcriptional regulator [Actinomadura graeca]
MKNKPPYSLGSVDRALHLASLLQQEGVLRVTDAAERLTISPSTAHRLLAMLVYRDFAIQAPDRSYLPGPRLRPAEQTTAPTVLLRRRALPHLRWLVETAGETAQLFVPSHTEVQIIATVECDRALRVGDRAGQSLPIHLASGGKAILAERADADLEPVYESLDRDQRNRLQRELNGVRANGFAVNDQHTETGLTALGVALHNEQGTAVAAIAVALPSVRFRPTLVHDWVRPLKTAAARIESTFSPSP